MTVDVPGLARELKAAYETGAPITTLPSSREAGLDLVTAYGVEAELVRIRRAGGHVVVGRKVGFANKAIWRALRLDTLLWAHMYDDTVHYAAGNCASLAIGHRLAPRIEPEIVFKLRKPLAAGTDAVAALDAVEWLALGFEVVDCLFPGWTFQPADFVAAFGLHTALVVGEPRMVTRDAIASLVEQLPRFTARLLKDGHLVEEGCGKNVLRSPALCLAELANAVSRQTRAEPLAAGDVISSGSLTAAPPIASGQEWRAEVDGLDLSPLTLRLDQWRLDQRLDQRLDTRLDQRRALPSQTCDNSRANRGR